MNQSHSRLNLAVLRASSVILAVSALLISCGEHETEIEVSQTDARAVLEQKLIGTTWQVSEESGKIRDGLIEFHADHKVIVNWAMKKEQGWIVVEGDQVVWGQSYRLSTFNEAITAFESIDLNGNGKLVGKLLP